MIPAVTPEIELWFIGALLVYCRIQACLMAMPAFSEKLLPARIKIALALALTPAFARLGVGAVAPEDLMMLAVAAGAEMVTGLVLGLLVRLMALALDVASSVIATTSSLSQLVGVTNEFAPHPIGNLLHLAGLAVLMALGFPLLVCDLIGQSFTLRPVGGMVEIQAILTTVVTLTADSFTLALLLAAPFILGGFLFQALSGVVSKVMPALPVVFIGAPAAILMALIGLMLLAPAIVAVWSDRIMSFLVPVLR
ncbi:flagellar biosynthetic protein FliR [Paracoccus aminophilus]|uniref:Flagellar biosynthetic protein FliR n=1 Tax=Paracoccus aminophilus JCM 7686 TaxID=1367847 RepID=S5Y7Y1_PARAH|nr:flagellar biosynthetic protein FliR [Paracoccus aminophilus]AGT07453.1 flagellar biosynthetic protein FliR [Paracoccus aminophilus JCM 7686]